MQYYPPPCGYPIGGPQFSYHNFAAAPCGRVVGEGDVTAVPLPGGGAQLYFVPARAPPSPYYPPCTTQPPWNSYPEAWFIRSVPIPFPPYQPNVFNQQAQRVISDPSFQQINAETKPSFHLKFHNDGWTSTTDIHCFYPQLRCHNWFPKQSVAIQASASPCPPEPPPPAPCSQPCLCHNAESKKSKKVTCACKELDAKCGCASKSVTHRQSSDGSNMSIECENCADQSKRSRKHKAKVKKRDHECECPPETHSKACATVTEQATSIEVGRETQASCEACAPAPVRRVASFLVDDVEVDFWHPKTPFSRRDMETTESRGACRCGCADTSESDA